MPTTVHIPEPRLQSVDRRAKALGVSRNRLIIRVLEEALGERPRWSAEFLDRLRDVDDDLSAAVDELRADVARHSRSKPARAL